MAVSFKKHNPTYYSRKQFSSIRFYVGPAELNWNRGADSMFMLSAKTGTARPFGHLCGDLSRISSVICFLGSTAPIGLLPGAGLRWP
jgi:hypothetical protein